jgi:hypothetical protein
MTADSHRAGSFTCSCQTPCVVPQLAAELKGPTAAGQGIGCVHGLDQIRIIGLVMAPKSRGADNPVFAFRCRRYFSISLRRNGAEALAARSEVRQRRASSVVCST